MKFARKVWGGGRGFLDLSGSTPKFFNHLSCENNEDASSAVEGDGDGDEGDDAAPPTHRLLSDAGVRIPNLNMNCIVILFYTIHTVAVMK